MAVETLPKELSSAQKEFQSLLNENLKNFGVKEGQTVEAVVTDITPKFLICDLKYKQEAMIAIDEFGKDLEKIKVGSTIKVYVERLESFKNELVVSYTKAKSMETWNKMLVSFESGEEVVATLVSKIKGGYIANCEGLNCFVPSSQLDSKPLRSISHLMGQPLKFIAVRVDTVRGNVALSRRAIIERSKDAETKEALKSLKEGDIVTGRVSALVEWGAFIEINNNLISLLHISDLSFSRVKKPSDILTVGQEIKCKVTKIDTSSVPPRVSVSAKALESDPYENLEKNIKIGSVYEGQISKLMAYGAFCRITLSTGSSIEGLIHSSEISYTEPNVDPSKILAPSQKVKVMVVAVDAAQKRISLSFKQANGTNPWKEIDGKIGTVIEVTINNITDKAIFANLDSGLTGMIHHKEISYNQEEQNLKNYKKGQKISVKIIDLKNQKLRFSIRQLGKNPWDWFKENKKKENSIITTKVVESLKTGIKVSIDLEKNIVVMIKKNQLAKEAADCRPEIFVQGNSIDCMITELDVENQHVNLSPKQAQFYEEKSLVAKFGVNAAKSGATLAGIFQKALGKTPKKKKKDEE
jgi:small subunit ribosomal protein S1